MTFFEAVSIGLAVAALFVVFWEMRELRFQLRMNTYMEYTARYSDILAGLPSKVLEDRDYSLEDCLREYPDFRISARRYFWLLQEEYFLQKNGLLPKDQWRIWESEFSRTLQLASLREVWQDLREEVVYPREFVSYVNEHLGKKPDGIDNQAKA
jgi:hypothetical protein